MTSNRFASVKALLLEVADLSESERRAYLGEVCRDDPDLRREVEKILAHGDDPTGLLKTGAIAPPRAPSTTLDATDLPAEIAGYRIVRKLGQGGMGVVYEAEQKSPRRPVALKVIRGGAYVDDQRIRLFQREAHALGRLKHPGIAAIYESGRTDEGQHFFAMELVRGVPLDEYLQKHPIEGNRSKDAIRQRLDLFLQICGAISYAHQRGVIHRDLKPGNILVLPASSGSHRGSGTDHSQVKILDFGLARMTDADVALTTMVTEVGKIQGTLAYMSPEQARGNPDEIDMRSDVYSLGVLFYELLTGALPYDVRRTMIHEAVRVICEEEPAKPSTIERTLRGDLETIALKALEKEPGRRYQSVSALAEDIDRYLTDQPILARPPSATYQLKKLVARHRAAFGFVATIVLALSVGLVLVTLQSARIAAARDEAELVTTTLEEMLASVDPTKSGRDVTVKEMLDETAKTLGEKFQNRPLVEARLRHTVGKTYDELGEYETAERHLEQAVEIRRGRLGVEDPGTLEAMSQLAWVYKERGRGDEATVLLQEAMEVSRRVLGEEHPQTLQIMHFLAIGYGGQDRKEAQALHRKILEVRRRVLGEDHPQTLRTMINLGVSYQNNGRVDEAEVLLREAAETSRRVLGHEHPTTLIARGNLAVACWRQGHYDEAEALHRETLEISGRVLGEEHPRTVSSMTGLAFAYRRQGHYDEAEALYREALEIRRRVLGEEHRKTLSAMSGLAWTYQDQGRYEEAGTLHRETLETWRRVSGEEHRKTLSAMAGLASTYKAQGRFHEAEVLYRETLEIRRRVLGGEHPHTLGSMEGLAYCYSSQGRLDEAETLLRETLETSRRVRGDGNPDTNDLRVGLACVLALQGRRSEAILLLRASLANGGPSNQSSIHDDPDLASLHGDPEFDAIVEELKRRNEDAGQ